MTWCRGKWISPVFKHTDLILRTFVRPSMLDKNKSRDSSPLTTTTPLVLLHTPRHASRDVPRLHTSQTSLYYELFFKNINMETHRQDSFSMQVSSFSHFVGICRNRKRMRPPKRPSREQSSSENPSRGKFSNRKTWSGGVSIRNPCLTLMISAGVMATCRSKKWLANLLW